MNLIATSRGRSAFFGILYFAEGAPIGYLWWALPTRLRAAEVPIEDIAALSALLTLPWTLKLLWAPLVDAFRPARGGLRLWICAMQWAMAITLLPVAWIDPTQSYRLLAGVLVVHALCAATQDVSIDALAVWSIPETERGRSTGWMQVGMLIGRGVFGGVSLWAERFIGSAGVVACLVGILLLTSGIVWGAKEDRSGASGSVATRLLEFHSLLMRVLRSSRTWLGLGIALLAGAGMEATGSIAGPLMIDRGIEQETVGWFFALPGVCCMALGALVGGILCDRSRRERALRIAILALWACILGVAGIASRQLSADPGWLLVGMAAAYFLFGVLTAASYALFMDLTDPRLAGTQFSAFMGGVNACAVWSTYAVGQLAGRFDYSIALAGIATTSLLVLPLLGRVHSIRRSTPE